MYEIQKDRLVLHGHRAEDTYFGFCSSREVERLLVREELPVQHDWGLH